MSELGNKFKEKRESLGLSLSEASLSTKITPRMIAAIEEGDLKALPALPFAKGFIRAYSSYLKLDPEEMVKIFIAERGGPAEPELPALEAEKKKEEERDSSPPVELNDESSGMKRFFIIGGVAVLIVAIVSVKSLIDKYKREGDLPSEEVVVSPIEKEEEKADGDKSTEAKSEEEAQPEDSASSETEAPAEEKAEAKPEEKTPEKTEVVKAPASAPAAPLPAAPPPVVAPVAPLPPAATPQVTTPPVVAKPVEAPKPAVPATPPTSTPEDIAKREEAAKKEAAAEKKQMEILFEALDNVQVNVSMGGQNKRISLNAGEVHVLRTNEKVQMEISDGGAVNLVVNGRSRGVPGSLGQKAKVQLP